MLKRSYCEILGVGKWNSFRLVKSSIRQLEYLISLKEAVYSPEFEEMFIAFVDLLINENYREYESLPINWVYCHDKDKALFLCKDNLALKVKNPVFPELFELPWIYQKDYSKKSFFSKYDCFNDF